MTVLVVGAGIIGASIADTLAASGLDVTVLDMRSPGRGASQASAGLLAPYIEGRSASPLLDLCARGLTRWAPFVERLRERGLDVPYERSGTLEVALNDDEVARLEDMHGWLAGLDVESELMTGDDVRRFEPTVSALAVGGLFIASQGFVAVPALVKAVVHSARLSGAMFEQPVEVVRIETFAGHVEVRADARRLTADAVVVASGAWSSRVHIVGAPQLPIRPVRGQLLHLTWVDGPLPERPVWGARCYTVPWTPNTLLVGATVEDVGFDERSTVAGVHDLLDGVGELLPGAWKASVAEVRVGLRPATADGMPIIGPLPGAPRICIAAGHYRNGVLLAPLTAEMVGEWIEKSGY